jgi:hypothetical protein
MKEIGDAAYFSKYNNRSDLGNGPNDGPRYPGRGPIQITGRHNYRKLSEWAFTKGYVPSPTYFEDRPEELEKDQYAFLGAIWYWTEARPKINEFCDWDNLEDSLVAVTKAINGGTNGLDDRRNRLNKARSMDLAPIMRGGSPVPPPPPVVPPITPSQPGSGFVYLTREQEMTVFKAAEKLLAPVPSNSPVRKAGEKNIGDVLDIIRFIDGNLHPILVQFLADKGDSNELRNMKELANVDLTQYPDRAYGKRLAQEILDDVGEILAAKRESRSSTAPVIFNVPPPQAPIEQAAMEAVGVIPTIDSAPVQGPQGTADLIGSTYQTVKDLLDKEIPQKPKDAFIDLLKKNTNTGEPSEDE